MIIKRHTDLEVYKRAYAAAMKVFELSKSFPKCEQYSLTDQIRRASRSVCANMSEGWRRRRYEAAFINKLSECEAEAAETQTWLQFAVDCKYADRDEAATLYREYDEVISMLVAMIHNAGQWVLK